MLDHLKIKNIALIDSLETEFGEGLNVLTGETGSGKSIIVDSLSALTGERVYSELIKEGESAAQIEGLFVVETSPVLITAFGEIGLELSGQPETEIIVRRELSATGKNRIFVNDQMVTQGFLKRIGAHLVSIHGQGEQTALYDVATHVEMLDRFSGNVELRRSAAASYHAWNAVRDELAGLKRDESDRLQLVDILRFQVDEIVKVNPQPGEESELEDEKRRLNNVEKISDLSRDAYSLLYENPESTAATMERAAKKISELSEYDDRFREFDEGIRSAQAVIQEAAMTARDLMTHLEFSPVRLEEIENRLAELTRLKRKYGGTLESVMEHLGVSQTRLDGIETSELRERELTKQLTEKRDSYVVAAHKLSENRRTSARKFEKQVMQNLRDVALENAVFEVRIETPKPDDENADRGFSSKGFDRVEFYFSANPGESPKPLAKVASGGEASRLMLILKTTARGGAAENAAVFDEIDTGIGGRVAEAVGRKLKELSATQQVLCVTHQAQIASLADRHFVVEKGSTAKRTEVAIRRLEADERIEELARMLAGHQITDAARENAKAMLAAAK